MLRLTLLAPEAILDGRQPESMILPVLMKPFRSSGGLSVHHAQAQGMLLAALGVLAAGYGFGPRRRAD